MFAWERSEARADVVAFVDQMNAAARRWPTAADVSGGHPVNVNRTLTVLRRVGEWAAVHGSRARNDFTVRPRFGKFYELLRSEGPGLLAHTYRCRPGDHRAVELPVYLRDSFGDPVAAAYGPEHELSFCMYLVALFKLQHLDSADEPYIVTVLFDKYDGVDVRARSCSGQSINTPCNYD